MTCLEGLSVYVNESTPVHEHFGLLGAGTGGGWIFQKFVDYQSLARLLWQGAR